MRSSLVPVCLLPQLPSGKRCKSCKTSDVEYKSGARYQGDLLGNQRSGHGIFVWPDGSRYEGDFVDNVRTGKGQFLSTFSSLYLFVMQCTD